MILTFMFKKDKDESAWERYFGRRIPRDEKTSQAGKISSIVTKNGLL